MPILILLHHIRFTIYILLVLHRLLLRIQIIIHLFLLLNLHRHFLISNRLYFRVINQIAHGPFQLRIRVRLRVIVAAASAVLPILAAFIQPHQVIKVHRRLPLLP